MRPVVAIGGFVLLMAVTFTLILFMHSGHWMVALPAAVLFFAWAAFVRRRLSKDSSSR